MKTHDLTVLIIRLVAVYIALQGIMYIAQAASMWSGGVSVYGEMPIWFIGLTVLSPLILGILLWFMASVMARQAVRGLAESMEVGGLSLQGLTAAAFSVFGVVLLIMVFPGFIVSLLHYFLSDEPSVDVPWLVARAFQCVVAVGLIVGSGMVARILFRLRYAGLDK